MNTSTMTLPARAQKRLSVIIFYTDFPAGVHAKMVADRLARLTGADVEPLLDIWKLDSIPTLGPLKQEIIRDAQQADVWILACSSPCDRDALIMQWMNSLTTKDARGTAPALLIGLFGVPKSSAENFAWFLDMFSLFAERAGRDFIWQPMNRESVRDMNWLNEPAGRLFREPDCWVSPVQISELVSRGSQAAGGDRAI